MQRMGMQMDEMKDVKRVIFVTGSKEIVLEGASVTAINVQGQKMYQVIGGKQSERAPQAAGTPAQPEAEAPKATPAIPEEDVLLVAQQANVSMDKARATLTQCEGDLAKAILMLTTR
jgi:nascent polypeptide-associated complex subunit alpha